MLEDEGVYVCEASNTLGNASSSVTFDAQGKSGQKVVALGQGPVLRTIPLQPGSKEGLSSETVSFSSGSSLSSPIQWALQTVSFLPPPGWEAGPLAPGVGGKQSR